MSETAGIDHARRYRYGRLAMRGGVLVALVSVLALPTGTGQMLLFLTACLAVAWGTWQRHRHCPARRGQGG